MRILKSSLLIISVLACFFGQAQNGITLDRAIAMALEKNRTIKVAVNRVAMSENQVSLGQAGLLPNVSASASYQVGENDTKIEIANQTDKIETKGAGSQVLQAGLNLDYTLFSGFANQRTYEKLKISASLADASKRVEVENIILQVASAFYNVIRTQENLEALQEAFNNSNERLERAQAKRELSGGTQLEELNAQVDFNKDKVAQLNAEKALQDAIDAFNAIAAGDLESGFVPIGEIDGFETWNLGVLTQDMLEQNAQILNARYSEQASLLDYQISKSAYYPQLNLNGSYAYSKNNSEGSLLVSNESLGYTAGLSLSIPIFQGGRRNTASKNANLQYESSQLQVNETELTMQKALRSAYRDYINSLEIVELETTNTNTTELNFQYSKQKYEQGLLTGLQFREAQVNLLLAKNNLNNVRYNAKLAELELMRLSGKLLE